VRSENDQEIRGGIPNNLIEKARHAINMSTGSPFHRTPHDNEESQRIFDKKVINRRDTDTEERRTERTIHQRKRSVDELRGSPSLESTEPEPIERNVRKLQRF
jgi:hypothetical protein